MAKAKAPPKQKKLTPEERAALTEACRALLGCWLKIRDFLFLAFQNTEIAREQEQSFLELKSETARSQRVVSGKIPEDLQFGSDKITDLLRQAISIAHLRGLPLSDKRGLVNSWHLASVMLHRAVGALEYIAETQKELASQKGRLRGIKAIKSEAAARGKRSKLPAIIGTLFVLAVVGAVAYYLFFAR